MMDFLVTNIQAAVDLAPVWGFFLIFAFMTIESSFIPFPSEIIMIPAGVLAARGELSFGVPWLDLVVALLAGLAGSLAGAYFNYLIAWKLGYPFLHKYGRYFFVKPDALDRAAEIFNRYGDLTTFICRLIPVIRQLISLPAGLSRMPLGRFTFFTGLGAGIWIAILGGVGWVLGKTTDGLSWREILEKGKDLVNRDLVWILLALVVLIAAYIAVTHWVMSRKSGVDERQRD